MSEDDLKAIISTYQQKCFEFFNSNVVMETQINGLKRSIEILSAENDKLKAAKSRRKDADDFT